MHSLQEAFILIVLVLIGLLVSLDCTKKEPTYEVRIGGIFDLSGVTHETSIPYTDGIRRYIDYINEKGEINGKRAFASRGWPSSTTIPSLGNRRSRMEGFMRHCP